MKRGEITVFFSLLLLVITMLVGTVLESARDATARERAILMTAVGLQSIWAAYDRPLYERYHVLAYDLSLGQDFSEERLRQAWADEAAAAAQTKEGDLTPLTVAGVELSAVDLLTDYQGAEFKAQAIAYIKRGFGVNDLQNWLDVMPDAEDIRQKEEQSEEAKRELTSLWEKLDAKQTESTDEALPQSWWEEMRTESAGVKVLQFLPEGFQLHQGQIDRTDLYENRQVTAWEGLEHPGAEGLLEKAALNEYYLRHFPSALTQTGEEDEKRLAYWLEYLLYGHEHDVQNLKAAMEAIHRLRLVANFVYLQTDLDKQSGLELPAVAVATLIGEPRTKEVIKQALMLYWADREAKWDCKGLLAGQKVALWKSAESWQTPLFGDLPAVTQEDLQTGEGIRFGYQDYLRLLLFWHQNETCERALSLIEYDLRAEPGYETVCLDRYMVSGRLTYQWEGRPLFPFALPLGTKRWTIERIYSY